MKKTIWLPAVIIALIVPLSATAEEKAAKKAFVPKPSPEQIFKYVDLVNKDFNIDKKSAEDTLGRWISGKLAADKEMMKLIKNKTTDAATCDVCIKECIGKFGTNPFCVAGCIAGGCK